MADRPILFSAPMVRALLAGRKTQTRRILKPQPPEKTTFAGFFSTGLFGWMAGKPADLESWEFLGDFKTPFMVGDRLWVRETWSGHHAFRDTPPARRESFATPDGPILREDVWLWADGNPTGGDYETPRPGIHMPRWASRLTLIVTDVKVERLQDISEADAMAEGVPEAMEGNTGDEIYCPTCYGNGVHGAFGANYGVTEVECADCATGKDRYRNLWNHINGHGSWDANPWVAAYTFSVIKQNIDDIARAAA